jgi:hypothetical protein
MYTLIHEHYRNPKELQGMPEWETDAWFHSEPAAGGGGGGGGGGVEAFAVGMRGWRRRATHGRMQRGVPWNGRPWPPCALFLPN